MSRRRVVALVLTALLATLLAVVAVWPQGVGLAGSYGPAQLVALRGLSIVAGVLALAGLLVLVLLWRHARPYLLTVAAVVAAATIFSIAVVASRGLDGDGARLAASDGGAADEGVGDTAGEVRVLSFNTLYDGVPATEIAEMVAQYGAHVVVLQETSAATVDLVAELTGGGFQVYHHQVDPGITSATGLLIAESLGQYGAPEPEANGGLGSFTVRPLTRGAPPITAVHAYPPTGSTMPRWREDTTWAVRRCKGFDGGIVAGDFNATLDHPALRDLEPCVDAAAERNAAAVGTWPTDWPPWAGTPIDHVMADSRVWEVVSFSVLDDLGGSDHRPVFATLRRR